MKLPKMKIKNKLVLIVDDNRVSNFFNKKIIKETKVIDTVVTIESGKEALNFINPKKSLEPYLSFIFLDLHMPSMNGWEFLEAYSKIEKINDCSIVVMYDKELLPEEALQLNQYDFVKTTTNKILTHDFVTEFFSKNKDTAVAQLKYS